jgi:adenosine kinase
LKIVVTGSIAFDYLMSFAGNFSEHFLPDQLDRISVSFLVDSLAHRNGGCAANISYSLALLGEHPVLFGTVGKDFRDYGLFLKNVGVDTSKIRSIENEYTASFFANTDQKGNQIASFYTGAMQHAKELSIRDVSDEPIDLLIISPNDPKAMISYVKECKELQIPYIFDPSQQIVRLTGEELKYGTQGARILILNDYELEMFKKKTGIYDDHLPYLVEVVIVTHGEKGSVIRTGSKTIRIPIVPPRQTLDPTGVGDAYRAGLIKGLIHRLSWETIGRMASLAAAYVLETEGPQSHQYDLRRFIERYCSVFGESEEIRELVNT